MTKQLMIEKINNSLTTPIATIVKEEINLGQFAVTLANNNTIIKIGKYAYKIDDIKNINYDGKYSIDFIYNNLYIDIEL